MTRGVATRSGLAAIACVLLLTAGACGSGDAEDGTSPTAANSTPTSTTSSGADKPRYALLEDPTWELTEAIDYRAGLGRMAAHDPDLDWFAEYDGPRQDHDDGSYTVPHLATFGHTAGLDTREEQLPGFDLRSHNVDGRKALVAAAAAGNPAVIVIEVATDYTLTLLIYDDGVDLEELATHLKFADEQRWLAAGGTMLDCVPLTPDCTT